MFFLANIFFIFLLLSFSIAKKSLPCPPFPHTELENGQVTRVPGDQKLLFRCDPGFFLAAPSLVRCWRGKWSSSRTPRCIPSEGQCEKPDAIPNGDVHGTERSVGSTIQYMCHPGFLLLGEGTRECLRSGHWNGITPACMDESEPLQKVAIRLQEHFVANLTSNVSRGQEGRLLDRGSIREGLELVILIDRSSSIDPVDFNVAINFVKFLIQQFGVKNGDIHAVGTRVAVLAFGSTVDLVFNLNDANITGPVAADKALNSVQSGGGGTAMEAALTSVFTMVSALREKAKKAIFLMTDGEPNIGTPGITVEDVAIQLKEAAGFEIFTMGVGRSINRNLLSSLASQPLLNHVFVLEKYSDLKAIMKAITEAPPEAKPMSPERCGYIKGEEFHLKKWPWLAAIYTGDPLHFCSGTLICSQWLLTAASCFTRENDTQGVFVVLGETNIVQQDKQQMNFYATKVILHPSHRPEDSLTDNLALVQLNSPVPLKRFRPACLPLAGRTVPLHMDLGINASTAGWGLPPNDNTGIDGNTQLFNRVTVPMELEEQHECRTMAGRSFNDKIFCAGFGKKSCVGDLGSPIVAVDTTTRLHHVIGVLGERGKCGEGTNFYSELSRYVPWINRVTRDCHAKHWT